MFFDDVDVLPARECRQLLSAVVTRTLGSVWLLSDRCGQLAHNRAANGRLIGRAKKALWSAEARFWAAIGETATDTVGRLRWHKSFPGIGQGNEAAVPAWVKEIRRESGFIRAAAGLPRLRRLLSGGRWSRSGLTWMGHIDPEQLMRLCPSPHRWERWLAKVRRRAGGILASWDLSPSWMALAELLSTHKHCLPPVGKAAVALAGATLHIRFIGRLPWDASVRGLRLREYGGGYVGFRPWWRVVADCRIFRQGGTPGRTVPPVRMGNGYAQSWAMDLTDRFGPQSDDDRVTIMSALLVADGGVSGMVIAARDVGTEQRPQEVVVQVIVRNPADGTRCHLTVPSQFGLPLWEGESAAGRVHAALAWGFGLTPAEYRPGVES